MVSVCLDCHHDRAGIHWPPKPYEKYLCTPHADPHQPSEAPSPNTTKRKRTQTELDESHVSQIVIDYRNLRNLIDGPQGLLATHRITKATLYKVLDRCNEPRRCHKQRHWSDNLPEQGTGSP